LTNTNITTVDGNTVSLGKGAEEKVKKKPTKLKTKNRAKGVIINNSPQSLPNASYESWLIFLDYGGYKLTTDKQSAMNSFVKTKGSKPVPVAEGIKFHQLIKAMHAKLSNSARYAWDLVLPPSSCNPILRYAASLLLMTVTPVITDDSIILVFVPFFQGIHVRSTWVLEEGELGIVNRLQALDRQLMTAHYILSATRNWKGIPRDYPELTHFVGVGPKLSWIFIAVCYGEDAVYYGDEQGVPCNVHMVQIEGDIGFTSQ
jgi:hypothetical protein